MEKIFLCDSKYFSSIIIYSYQYDDRQTSDEQTISSYKKPSKPVPPRKPSFLYLNRASSLQSVNGGSVVKMSTAHSNKQFDTDDDEVGWNNNTAPSSKSSLRSALSTNPLSKWNILSE